MKLLRTLEIVPDVSGKRYSTVELGTANALLVRQEFMLLRDVVAALCGVEPAELTQEHVVAVDAKKLRESLRR